MIGQMIARQFVFPTSVWHPVLLHHVQVLSKHKSPKLDHEIDQVRSGGASSTERGMGMLVASGLRCRPIEPRIQGRRLGQLELRKTHKPGTVIMRDTTPRDLGHQWKCLDLRRAETIRCWKRLYLVRAPLSTFVHGFDVDRRSKPGSGSPVRPAGPRIHTKFMPIGPLRTMIRRTNT